MASALKKFQQLEQQQVLSPAPLLKSDDHKPAKKNKLSLYGHILSSFENTESSDEKKRKTIERLKQREMEKKARERERREEEKRRLEEEMELKRLQKEEEERRIQRQKEEEEEKKRLEEVRRKEAEEEERRRQEWEKKEGKYVGLKPAAAMFQRALDAKGAVRTVGGDKKVTTLKKGTISEIRSRIFDQQPAADRSKSHSQTKQQPKKLIIPTTIKSETNKKSIDVTQRPVSSAAKLIRKTDKECADMPVDNRKIELQVKEEKNNEKNSSTKDNNKVNEYETNTEDKSDENANKRQSFISDFAALEKTYKILGLSKEENKNNNKEEEVATVGVKKRHNSEGKVKNKDKAKTKRKSAVVTGTSSATKETKEQVKPAKVDLVLKLENEAKRNFFQDKINRSKGLKCDEDSDISGNKVKKKGGTFEQSSAYNEKNKRQSLVVDDVRVDNYKFNTFLDRFESKDGREEARIKMKNITKKQKELAKQKQLKEEQALVEEALRREREEQEKVEAAREAELAEKMKEEEENNLARMKAVEESFIKLEKEEDAAATEKKKATKKKCKKKTKKVEEVVDSGPKKNLLAGDISNVRSMFEGKRLSIDGSKEPARPVRINKISINPFENINKNDVIVEREVKVNKLKKDGFIEQLENMGCNTQEVKKTATKNAPTKKTSGDTFIKFESKKEKKNLEENHEQEAKEEKKSEIRVSKSIEGSQPGSKSNKAKKTGSTMSLHKIFIEGPKEFFKSSKEKLYKLSKEALCETAEKNVTHEETPDEKKPSRNEMQNYLLSHVLFDGKEITKKEKPTVAKKEEIEEIDRLEDYLDDEYRAKIEQYCSLLEDDKPKRKKKKKNAKTKKQEETLPAIKTIEIKAIQEQLQQQMGKAGVTRKLSTTGDNVLNKQDGQVNRVKDKFDNDAKEERTEKPTNTKRRSQQAKSEIFQKIKVLEDAEKERLERERQNEERIHFLLQREMERLKASESENKKTENTSQEEDEAELELKQNILQCLEDEVDNLEQEMIALDTQEQLIIDEELEDDLGQNILDSGDIEEHKVHLQEIHEGIVERKKHAADKKREVLKRFQHVLDANEDDDKIRTKSKIGKIHDRLNMFNPIHEDQGKKKDFEDTVFVGVSDVISKVKEKLENQEEDKKLGLLSKEDVKRKANATAAIFEKLSTEDDLVMSPAPRHVDWSWKKKTAAELDNDLNNVREADSVVKSSPQNKKSSKDFQETKFCELLADINAVKQRLSVRDIEKENEQKIQEMEELIDGVKESLKQHEEEYLFDEDEDCDEPFYEYSSLERTSSLEPFDPHRESKIEQLRNQLTTMIQDDSKDRLKTKSRDPVVSVSRVRDKIITQNMEKENTSEEQEARNTAKRSISSNISSKLAEILPSEEKEATGRDLRKAPKMVLKSTPLDIKDETAPAKTLEDLKAEQENRKWAWKEKELEDLHNFINQNDDIAPKDMVKAQKNIKELEEELTVMESIQGTKNAAILAEMREEKEREFKEFMDGVQSYLMKENTYSAEENNFKEKIKGYLDLMGPNTDSHDADKRPALKLNTVSQLKNSLLDWQQNESKEQKNNNAKVNKLEVKKIEAILEQDKKLKQAKETIVSSGQTKSVKQIFEEKQNMSLNNELIEKKNLTKSTFAEKFAKRARDENMRKYQHQFQYKQKTINDLHMYIENNEALADRLLLRAVRDSRVGREEERLVLHEVFMERLFAFLKEPRRSEEQSIFMANIEAYLAILENTHTNYNATPKLSKHSGRSGLSNMRKALIEKSVERPSEEEKNKNNTEKKSGKSETAKLSAEEKKKQILSKYGLKERSRAAVEAISDDDDEDDDNDESAKKLTDRELAERYGLPYVPDSSDLYQASSQTSCSAFTGLLSKIRQASTEKAAAVSSTKKVFEERRQEEQVQPRSPAVVRRRGQDSVGEETLPELGSRMTDKIKRKFEQQSCTSLLVDDEVDALTSAAERRGPIRSASTSMMRKVFESPETPSLGTAQRSHDPGSAVTSQIKKRFEEQGQVSGRHSLLFDDDSSDDSRSGSPVLRSEAGSANTSKLRSRFENTKPATEELTCRTWGGLQKSCTVSDMSQNRHAEKLQQKAAMAAKYFSGNTAASPQVSRVLPIEKSKSFSKFKNAFESGKGLNVDSSDDETEPKTGVAAELEALRTAAQKPKQNETSKATSEEEQRKRSLAASFFASDKTKTGAGTGTPVVARRAGPIKSCTVSDVGSLLRLQQSSVPQNTTVENTSRKISCPQVAAAEAPSGAVSQRQTNFSQVTPPAVRASQHDSVGHIPESPRPGKLQKSSSFSKFKNAFEDGRGLMDGGDKSCQAVEQAQRRVGAEIAALKSSSKIQNMFRINRSRSSPAPESPSTKRRFSSADIDENAIKDMSQSRSAITDMFEAKGPKITFGGGNLKTAAEKTTELPRPKAATRKPEASEMNERKWVFDTIQKYFDVIVEEDKEEEEQEDDDDDDYECDLEDDSESEYSDAEDCLPQHLTVSRERSGTLPSSSLLPKQLPPLTLPTVQRASSLRVTERSMRASTASPATVPVTVPVNRLQQSKVSAISIEDVIDDAAKQFDQLTDGSDLSLEDLSTRGAVSTGRGRLLQKSSSSSRIRNMLQAVVHGSNTSLDVATFKTNLQAHLSTSRNVSRAASLAPRGARNPDPGVGDDSSSDYSEYD